jgi:hypothetical protein
VPEEEVVVLAQQAHRRRDVRVRPRRIREVEELSAALVAEDDQAVAEPLEHLSELREARPVLSIQHGCRAEGAQIAQHEVLE